MNLAAEALEEPNPYAAMTDEALLGLLATEEDQLPRAAVEEIVSRRARMIGPLTQIVTTPESWEADLPSWWAPIHATFLLGAIGGNRRKTSGMKGEPGEGWTSVN